jgi:N-acetylglucosaminyl-diphospho-decaprenol L-rhamnosyltransferase
MGGSPGGHGLGAAPAADAAEAAKRLLTGAPVDESAGSIAAVVVDFNAGDRLRRCVESLRVEGCAPIVVVDNSTRGSTRSTLGPGTGVVVVDSPTNGGFGAGVNLGVSRTGSRSVLVCNPDVELRPGTVQVLARRLRDDAGVALVSPALLDLHGLPRPVARPLPSVRRSAAQAFIGLLAPTSRAARRHRERQGAMVAEGSASWVPGTCLLVRREAFDEVRGFDEAFFLYLEEVDLCRRLSERGWRVAVEPEAQVLHAGGVSTGQQALRSVVAYHVSLWRYMLRSVKGPERLALPLLAIAILLRFAVAVAVGVSRSPSSVLAAPVEVPGDAPG